jgi:hypothetical protein
MLTMAVGHSDDIDALDAIAVVIEQCRASLGGLTPQAGILFAAFDSFDPAIVAAVREAFPGVAVMGSTSAAEISSVEGYQQDSITLALFVSDTVDVTVGLGADLLADVDAACRAAVNEALAGTRRDPKIAIVLAEGLAGMRNERSTGWQGPCRKGSSCSAAGRPAATSPPPRRGTSSATTA